MPWVKRNTMPCIHNANIDKDASLHRYTKTTKAEACFLFAEQQADEDYLCGEDGRNSVAELLVEGFVAEEVHGQEGGGGAAEGGEEEQRGLGDATRLALASLAIADGLPLVETVGEEGQQVDRHKIE